MMLTAGDMLRIAAALFEQRASNYRDNHERLGGMLAAAFPEGIDLKTPEDHARFALLSLVLVKLTRYTVQWESGHADSINDAIVYLAMLGARDANRSGSEHGSRGDPRPVRQAAKPSVA
jgi:hypothetical protein